LARPKDEEGKITVRLALDPDAADLLLQLAGSERKQGAYISNLIRAAATQGSPDPTVENVRLKLLGLSKELENTARTLSSRNEQTGIDR
jgi:hypothetical protein